MPDDLRHAGELLRDLYTSDSLTSRNADVEHLTAFYAKTPADPTAAVGLTLLAMAKLSAHMGYDLASTGYDELPTADDHARTLAADVVTHATHARELDPNDNLSAFAQGFAHELRGEHAEATDAYRAAVHLDPNDHPAIARLETITGEEFDSPDDGPPCTHAGAFYLLELIAPANEEGEQERVVLLSTDATAVRAEADAYFAANSHTHDDLDYSIETHQPGEEPEADFLLAALEEDADGRQVIAWDDIEMPPLREPLLPPGRAVRENGEVHFFGRNVSVVEEDDDEPYDEDEG